MASLWLRIGLLAPLVAGPLGCTPLDLHKRQARSPLRPAQISSDAVVLEVFFARFPAGDPQANGALWQEIDEQCFAPQARREWAQNGFRAGLVGVQVPVALAQLLDMRDAPPPSDGVNRVRIDEAGAEPRVTLRRMSLRPGCRAEVVASAAHDEMTVLRCEAGGPCGRTYPKAHGIFALQAVPQRDGRVRVELVPEVHYGEPVQRWLGEQGVFRLDTGRQRQAYADLGIAATLAPGEMLVLTCLPDRESSLGHYFFTAPAPGEPQQKLLLVRVAQTQHDGLFSPGEPLPLDDVETEGRSI